jgi:eukaryotic-like serine/threonine-protein kinase
MHEPALAPTHVAAPSAPAPALGRIGRYELIDRLGGGGMAEVFRARIVGAEGFSRRVAIKRVLPGYSDNPAFAAMFVGEAQVCARMQHPNVVSVIDFDRDADRRLFLVMELVDGVDLDKLMASGPLPAWAIIYVITEVLRGLGYAHELPGGRLVHRDVSPHNVLVSWEGAVKVSDFGIAKIRAEGAASASVMIKGKPAYMSPEQASGGAIDGRSDLFAAGIMLWELLACRRLFTGDTQEVLAQLFCKPIATPSESRPTSEDLEAVCMRLLSRDVDARYRTAEEAIADLAGCADAPRDGRGDLVRLLAERFAVAGHSAPARGSIPTPISTFGARRPARWPIAVVLGLLAAAAAATTFAVLRRDRVAEVAPVDAVDAAPVTVDAAPAPVDAAVDAAPPPVEAAVDVVAAPDDADSPPKPASRRRRPRNPTPDNGIREVQLGR